MNGKLFSRFWVLRFGFSVLGFALIAVSSASIGMCDPEVVLVTGASRGIGAAIANQLADRGYIVYAGVRTGSTKKNLRTKEAGGVIRPIVLDVTDDQSVHDAVTRVLAEEKHIDILINNAGIMIYGSHENVTIEEAKNQFEVNYFGFLRVSQAVLPSMREKGKGRLIQIGSRSGFRPIPSLAVYADSKAAVLSASEVMAANLKPWNIKVSVIEPGPVLTELDASSPYGSRLEQGSDPYRMIFGAVGLLAPKPGSALGVGGQKPEEIARLVELVIETSEPALRYQTTGAISAQAGKRAVDPTGNSNVEELLKILKQ